jgi:hypothetical protein
MEKIACQLALVMHENYYIEQDDLQLNEEKFEADLFSFLTNLFQSSDKHFGHFLLSDFDEISWRLDYFDKLLEKELPQLSLHFKAIGLQSQLFLYDWLLTLFASVLPPQVCSRLWDQYFLRGELFLYQVALGLLRYLQSNLISVSPLNFLSFVAAP